jgi:hypothetical protein
MDFVLVKVFITTLAFLLGVLNLLVMLEMMEKIRLFGLPYEVLSLWHRRQGDALLVLFFTAAAMCVKFFVLEGEPDWGSPRVAAHMVVAALLLCLVVSKVLIVNLKPFKRGYRFIDCIGASLFTSLVVVFGTSSSAIERESPNQPVTTEVTLRLLVDRLEPLHLRYTSSQRYDIAVKNERGETVYLWSATAVFLQVVSEEDVLEREYRVPLTLDLPDGRYQVEAWLTTDARDRQFSAVAPLSVLTAGTTSDATKYIRVRTPR